MSNLKIELENTNYNDLKSKFEELGVPQLFKRGVKKVDLINEAIEVISKIEIMGGEGVVFDEAKNKVDVDKLDKVSRDKIEFDIKVDKVVANKSFWTKESIDKRIRQLHNVFTQHRGMSKGIECLEKRLVLEAASKIMFKK